jgi:hypothetical protein
MIKVTLKNYICQMQSVAFPDQSQCFLVVNYIRWFGQLGGFLIFSIIGPTCPMTNNAVVD